MIAIWIAISVFVGTTISLLLAYEWGKMSGDIHALKLQVNLMERRLNKRRHRQCKRKLKSLFK